MVDFLKGLSFIILPLGLGSKRLEFFENNIKKFAGKVKDESKPTHIIIDESVGEHKEKCLTALKTYGINLNVERKFVGTKWLSKCFGEKTLVDTQPFEFSWMTAELEILKLKSTYDKKCDNTQPDYNCSKKVDGPSPIKKKRIEETDHLCTLSSTSDCIVFERKQLIIDELKKLAEAFAARKDTWRAYSYKNAISAVLRYEKDITSFQEACSIPGIGEKMALKIMEILECGNLAKVENIVDDKTKILEYFCNIWGVGPATAENWYRQGCRSLDDLKIKAKLNKQQEIGIKLYHDFLKKMTREEVEKIFLVVKEELKHIQSQCSVELVGSYRRGRATCGDIDIMLINPTEKYPVDILLQLTDKLRTKNYLTDDLVSLCERSLSDTENHRKYMGVFKFPGENEIYRRIDIFVIPASEYAAGLMHYTGSAAFNRKIRLHASRKGMTLTEHGLYRNIIRKGSDKLNDGELVPISTEKEIFDHLGLEYKSPEERDH